MSGTPRPEQATPRKTPPTSARGTNNTPIIISARGAPKDTSGRFSARGTNSSSQQLTIALSGCATPRQPPAGCETVQVCIRMRPASSSAANAEATSSAFYHHSRSHSAQNGGPGSSQNLAQDGPVVATPRSARGLSASIENGTSQLLSYQIEPPQIATSASSPRNTTGANTPLSSRDPAPPVPPPLLGGPGNVPGMQTTNSNSNLISVASQPTVLTLVGPAASGVAQDSGSPLTEEKRTYEFTDVFGPDATDDKVRAGIVPKVAEQVRNGYNAAIMCYGQTGSGKTHTINAIMPAVVDSIFSLCEEMKDVTQHIVEVSYLQIYNNNVYNLLPVPYKKPPSSSSTDYYGEILPRPKGFLLCEPFITVDSSTEVLKVVADAQKRRATSHHALNPRSSRSHTLLSLRVTKYIDGTAIQSSKVTLADLAGTERLHKTLVEGDGKGEAIAINKSLMTLHSVITAVAQHNPVLPFRESLLTLYLAQSLTNSFMILIATIPLEVSNYGETRNTLDFATTAKKCVVTRTRSKASDRVSRAPSYEASHAQLLHEIEALRHRLNSLKAEAELERERNTVLEERLKSSSAVGSASCVSSSQLLLSGGSSTVANGTGVDITVESIRHYIAQIEKQHAQLNSLLREKEEELSTLESNSGSVQNDVTNDFEARVAEQEAARRDLASTISRNEADGTQNGGLPNGSAGASGAENCRTSGGASGGVASQHDQQHEVTRVYNGVDDILREKLEKVNESFLWMEEQFNSEKEKNAVLEKALAGLRDEHRKVSAELYTVRKSELKWEAVVDEKSSQIKRLVGDNSDLLSKNADLDLLYRREMNDRHLRAEHLTMLAHVSVSNVELESITRALEENKSINDSMQKQLAESEVECQRLLVERAQLVEEIGRKDDSFRGVWKLLTPAQKFQLGSSSSSHHHSSNSSSNNNGLSASSSHVDQQRLSISSTPVLSGSTGPVQQGSSFVSLGGTDSSIQALDVVHLRSQLKTASKERDETRTRLREQTVFIDELVEQRENLQEALRQRDRDYEAVMRLEVTQGERGDSLEQQLENLYQEIDAHARRHQQYEQQLRRQQEEWSQLDEDYKEAQRTINALRIELDANVKKLEEQEKENDLNNANIKDLRLELEQLKHIEAKLRETEIHKEEIGRKRDQAERNRQHTVGEVEHHVQHGAYIYNRMDRLNPDVAKKNRKMLLNRELSQAIKTSTITTSSNSATAAQRLKERLLRDTTTSKRRYEVNQILRHARLQQNQATGVTSAASGGYRDPSVPLTSASSVPPPPSSLPSGGSNPITVNQVVVPALSGLQMLGQQQQQQPQHIPASASAKVGQKTTTPNSSHTGHQNAVGQQSSSHHLASNVPLVLSPTAVGNSTASTVTAAPMVTAASVPSTPTTKNFSITNNSLEPPPQQQNKHRNSSSSATGGGGGASPHSLTQPSSTTNASSPPFQHSYQYNTSQQQQHSAQSSSAAYQNKSKFSRPPAPVVGSTTVSPSSSSAIPRSPRGGPGSAGTSSGKNPSSSSTSHHQQHHHSNAPVPSPRGHKVVGGGNFKPVTTKSSASALGNKSSSVNHQQQHHPATLSTRPEVPHISFIREQQQLQKQQRNNNNNKGVSTKSDRLSSGGADGKTSNEMRLSPKVPPLTLSGRKEQP